MKDKYLKPEVEIEKFKMAEVITTSDNGDDNDEVYNPDNLFA